MSSDPAQDAHRVPRLPTLETVAAVAGVSRATVSRVVNGSSRVDPELRRLVEQAVATVGYVPNRAARSLVTRRTDAIGLVVREPVEFGAADPYLAGIVVAASQSLVGTGVHLAVMMACSDDDHSTITTSVRAAHVDGVILVSVHDDDPLPGQLVRAGIPLVLGGRPAAPLGGGGYVDVDNVGGGRTAGQRLTETGRRRLAVITGPADMTAAADRLEGFLAQVAESGLPEPVIVEGAFTRASGERATTELLARRPDVDGIFAANDLMAIGAVRALRDAGRRIPDDVAVIGFDDIELCRYVEPPLTTVHQPAAQQARTMV